MKHNRWLLIFIFAALMLLPLDSTAIWQKYTVNSSQIAGTFWCLTVTAGRNGDSTTYLYATQSNQNIYEYSWDGSAWNGGSIGVPDSGYETRGITVGDGRNDGTIRLYVTSSSGNYSEFTYAGGWSDTLWLGSAFASEFRGCVLGKGQDAGTNRLYCANIQNVAGNGGPFEFSYSGTFWLGELTTGAAGFWDVALGTGRNDGTQRLYAANQDHHIYEYYYNGGGWTQTNVAAESDSFYCVAVGPGSHAGSLSVFGGYGSGLAYEYYYNGGGWQRAALTITGSGGQPVWGLAIGDARNDGSNRVYASYNNGHTFEFTWGGSVWNGLDMGATTGGVPHGVCVGRGRDGNNSVFVGADDGFIYEYHWVPDTPTATTTPTFTASATPTVTNTPTSTATPSSTPTSTVSGTFTFTITPTATPTPTFSSTPSCSPTLTISATNTISPTPTSSPTATPTPTFSVTVIPYPDLSAVVVYPNPCRAREKVTSQIKFGHLPQQVTIRIYALTGGLVRTLEKNNQLPTLAWDLKNEHGYALASGVYIFIVRDEHGREFKGKVALLH